MEKREVEVALALGANVGNPIVQLRAAVAGLKGVVRISAISDVYVTEPIGIRDQPDFLNLVVRGSTCETVYALHAEAQRIESRLGRVRGERNGPRAIDIDILAFGPLVLHSPSLTLPHPRLHERAFVLVPLAEIDPDWRHPLTGLSATEMLRRLDASSGISRAGPLGPLESELT